MLWLTLLLSFTQTGLGMVNAARSVQVVDDRARGVQLLRKAQDAMGGAAKLAAVRDTTHVMDITLEQAAAGYKLTQTSRYAAPHFRQEQETPFGRIVVYSDGTTGWIKTPDGKTPLTGEVLATVRGVLFRQPSGLMLSDGDPSRSVNAIGSNVVEVTSTDGQQVQLEFSPETGLLLQQSYVVVASNGRRVPRRETFSDWRDVDGVRFPFGAVQYEDDTKMLELRVSEYHVNTGLNAADLSRP